MCHLPPTIFRNLPSNKQFIDEFSECFAEVLTEHWNLVIMGDFNLHVNDPEDQDGEIFIDTMLTLGLDQHIIFPTHRSNNTLGLVLSECLSTYKILSCKPGPYFQTIQQLSSFYLSKKSTWLVNTSPVGSWKSIDVPSLIENLQLEDQTDPDNMDDMAEWLETKLWTALDKHALEKEKYIMVRSSNLWFTDEIKEQKRIVRRREQIWRWYGLIANWTALKTERQKYKRLLRDVKTQTICNKVADCNQDAKKLYSLMSYLTGTKVDNPMPEHTDNEQLADEFADFFMGKVKTLRDSLADIWDTTLMFQQKHHWISLYQYLLMMWNTLYEKCPLKVVRVMQFLHPC